MLIYKFSAIFTSICFVCNFKTLISLLFTLYLLVTCVIYKIYVHYNIDTIILIMASYNFPF